jgi:hypothetical protein
MCDRGQQMKFGQYLLENTLIEEEDLFEALAIQDEQSGERLKVGQILVAIDVLSHDQLKTALKEYGVTQMVG